MPDVAMDIAQHETSANFKFDINTIPTETSPPARDQLLSVVPGF